MAKGTGRGVEKSKKAPTRTKAEKKAIKQAKKK